MPSPSRRPVPPPPRITSRSSPRRQRSPDRRRRAAPASSSRPSGSSRPISPSRSRDRRRSPEHSSRRSPDARSRPSSNRPLNNRRSRSPVTAVRTDSNGRSFAPTIGGKRKATPKQDMSRGHELTDRGSRTVIGPRIVGKEGVQIPLIGPAVVSPPHSYSRPAPLTAARHYSGSTEPVVSLRTHPSSSTTVVRGYPADSPPLPSKYVSTSSRGYVKPSVVKTETRSYVSTTGTSSRGHTALAATGFRRSPSEERIFQRTSTSAQNRATRHMTSSRFAEFAGRRDDDDDDASAEMVDLNRVVFNVDNELSAKYSRSSPGVVRNIVHPESLRVVRQPGMSAIESMRSRLCDLRQILASKIIDVH